MSDLQRDDAFEGRVAELLADSADDLDGSTRAALLRARRRAVEAAGLRAKPVWRYLAPAGAAAAMLLAIVLVTRPDLMPQRGEAAIADTGPDLDLVTDADDWDIAQEPDLEFIEWAAAMARQQGAGS